MTPRGLGAAASLLALLGARGALRADPDKPSTCAIVGHVTSLEGPIVHAIVELRLAPAKRPDRSAYYVDALHSWRPLLDAPVARVETDEQGSFRFSALRPGLYQVRARSEGNAEDAALTDLSKPKAVEEARLILPRGGHVLRGSLRRGAHAPFRGWLAVRPVIDPHVEDLAWGRPPVATDEQGRFEIGMLPAGRVRLLAVEPDRQWVDLGLIDVPAEEPLALDVEEGLIPVRGRVVGPSGSGAEGVVVSLAGDLYGTHAVWVMARSGPDGRFESLCAPGAEIRLHDERFSEVATLGLMPDGALSLTAKARPEVAGVVLGPDERPVGGVRVQIRYGGSALADAQGRFRLRLAGHEDESRLSAEADGWKPRASTTAETYYPGHDVVLHVVRALRVDGRVLGPDGLPHAGAAINLSETWPMTEGTREEWQSSAAYTDADGRFSLEVNPSVTSRLVASAPGYANSDGVALPRSDVVLRLGTRESGRGRLTLPEGARVQDVVLRDGRMQIPLDADATFAYSRDPWLALPIEARVWVGERFFRATVRPKAGEDPLLVLRPAAPPPHALVRLVDPDGRPVPDGRWRADDGQSRDVIGAVENGLVLIELASADAQTKLDCDELRDLRGHRLPVAAVRGRSVGVGLTVINLERTRPLEGRLALPDGRPVVGVKVVANEKLDDGWRWVEDARSGIDGHFRIDGLAQVPHRLEVEAHDPFDAPEPVQLPAGAAQVEITVLLQVAPHIVVLDPEGRPVVGARVRLAAPEMPEAQSGGGDERTSGADGAVDYPPLSPRLPIHLRVIPPDESLLPHVESGWHAASVTVRLERAWLVRGSVRDAAGAAVPDASIWVRAADGARPLPADFSFETALLDDSKRPFFLATTTHPDGTFRLPPLPETTLEVVAVRVDAAKHESRSPTVVARPGSGPLLLSIADK